MKTLKVDSKRRVIIPGAAPGQVLAYESQGDGRFLLTVVIKRERKPRVVVKPVKKNGMLMIPIPPGDEIDQEALVRQIHEEQVPRRPAKPVVIERKGTHPVFSIGRPVSQEEVENLISEFP